MLQRLLVVLSAIFVFVPVSATAQPIPPNFVVPAASTFVWHGDLTESGPIRVFVGIEEQLALVFRGHTLIGASSVSTGKPGHETPTGDFTILEMDRDHVSNLYDDAPMPFMLRLTWDGIALHAGHVSGTPLSHGCVRLPRGFAERLFALAELGTSVTIVEQLPMSAGTGDFST